MGLSNGIVMPARLLCSVLDVQVILSASLTLGRWLVDQRCFGVGFRVILCSVGAHRKARPWTKPAVTEWE